MKLSDRQQKFHWRHWNRVKAVLMPGRETWTKVEEDQRRHELYLKALGEEVSLTQMTNVQFDLVIGEMRAIVEPGNLNAQLHALSGQRKRLLFGIGKLARSMGVDEFYVAGIVRTMNAAGKLGSSDLDDLGPAELTKVIVALRKHEHRGVVQHASETGEMPF